MRILDKESGKTIQSIILMLTPNEAKELADKLSSIHPEFGDHIHIDDENFLRGMTVLVYTNDNLKFFTNGIKEIILDENG